MENIVLVKESSLLRDVIVKVLQNAYGNSSVQAFGSTTYDQLYRIESSVDVLIIDIDTKVDLFNLIDHYRKNDKKIIIWASDYEDENLIELFKRDLDGYLYNGMEEEELLKAVDSVLKHEKYLHPKLSMVLFSDYVKQNSPKTYKPVGILSTREWEVLEQLTEGKKNDEIARVLFISEKTVKNHVSNILDKLQVSDRTNAVLKALKAGWFAL